jgi:hypothetical protein
MLCRGGEIDHLFPLTELLPTAESYQLMLSDHNKKESLKK